jgi:hypothetical protein
MTSHVFVQIRLIYDAESTTKAVLCVRNDQQYALICTTHLFYVLAPACFGISLPSSGSFLDSSELPEIQVERVVYHIMCGYVTCVPECRGSVRHTGHVTTHYIIYHPFDLYFK